MDWWSLTARELGREPIYWFSVEGDFTNQSPNEGAVARQGIERLKKRASGSVRRHLGSTASAKRE